MRTSLLIVALVLTTVWATGCIIVDAGSVQSREPTAVRSAEVEVHQSHVATPSTPIPPAAPTLDQTVEVGGQ